MVNLTLTVSEKIKDFKVLSCLCYNIFTSNGAIEEQNEENSQISDNFQNNETLSIVDHKSNSIICSLILGFVDRKLDLIETVNIHKDELPKYIKTFIIKSIIENNIVSLIIF